MTKRMLTLRDFLTSSAASIAFQSARAAPALPGGAGNASLKSLRRAKWRLVRLGERAIASYQHAIASLLIPRSRCRLL